jgi:hypothetical protein
MQLTIHRLLWVFTMLNPSLRELPGMLTNTLTPKNFVALIDENDADVGSVPFSVEHNRALYSLIL